MSKFLRYTGLVFGMIVLLGAGGISVRAQGTDDDDPYLPGRRKDPAARSIQENLFKMRIDKEKKDFNEMVKRGDDAAKLAQQLKEDVTNQQEQISSIGRLVKKIRDELGAEGAVDDPNGPRPDSQTSAIKALKDEVNGLSEDLKKCTRFTVSASAIDRTNAILRLVKFLHG